MKVICINANGELDSDEFCDNNPAIDLIDGETYIVANAFIDEGYCWYVLEEDESGGFDSRRFERLAETDKAVSFIQKLINRLFKPTRERV